ncbi:MAG: ABC transporter permease [Puniceicoccales bacterium]|jgi:lipoprotein-releasing system permease protein|nr:ABC transporter permease [Puniceicoccales bacterium]
MHWSIYLALKHLFPSGRKFTFFTAMSIVGVALGVAVLVVVLSVMNGFQAEIRRNLIRIQGEIRVECPGLVEDLAEFERKMRTFSEIEAVAPYGCGIVMLIHNGQPAFPLAKGITEDEAKVTGIGELLKFCSLEDLDRDRIILGEQLAMQLGIRLGDRVELYSPLALESLQNEEIIFPREVEVMGFFEADGYDKNAFLCSLERMQDLYALGEGAHGFTIRVKPGYSVEKFAEKLQAQLGSEYRVTDWIHGNSELLFALRWEKTMMLFVLLFILLVASFSISSMLITNVVRRTREIGVIIAIGGNRRGIARCFCLQGFFVGICGTFLGILSGVGVLYFRDGIMSIVDRVLTGNDAQNYLSQFTHLPVEYAVGDFIFIGLFSVIICIFSGILPGLKAARIHPANALRYEF